MSNDTVMNADSNRIDEVLEDELDDLTDDDFGTLRAEWDLWDRTANDGLPTDPSRREEERDD